MTDLQTSIHELCMTLDPDAYARRDRSCGWCARPVGGPVGRGRPRAYCTSDCRTRAQNYRRTLKSA